jgi:hypothetical protein
MKISNARKLAAKKGTSVQHTDGNAYTIKYHNYTISFTLPFGDDELDRPYVLKDGQQDNPMIDHFPGWFCDNLTQAFTRIEKAVASQQEQEQMEAEQAAIDAQIDLELDKMAEEFANDTEEEVAQIIPITRKRRTRRESVVPDGGEIAVMEAPAAPAPAPTPAPEAEERPKYQGQMIMAEVLNPELSKKYVAISTSEVVDQLMQLGFQVRNKITQKGKKGGTGIHSVRMFAGDFVEVNGDKMRPEIIITNSFDGTSAFKVSIGIYRLVCSNGLTILSEDFGYLKLRHMGTPAETAMEIVREMAEKAPMAIEFIKKMQETQLSEEKAVAFAMAAAKARWNKEFTKEQAAKLLEAARPEDGGQSLWHVFNVVQEKAFKPGLEIAGLKRKTRQINNAWLFEKTNADLFKLAAEQMN